MAEDIVSVERGEERGSRDMGSSGCREVGRSPDHCDNVEHYEQEKVVSDDEEGMKGEDDQFPSSSGETHHNESAEDQNNDSGGPDGITRQKPHVNPDFELESRGNKQDEVRPVQSRVVDGNTENDETRGGEQAEKRESSTKYTDKDAEQQDNAGLTNALDYTDEDKEDTQITDQYNDQRSVSEDEQIQEKRTDTRFQGDEEENTGAVKQEQQRDEKRGVRGDKEQKTADDSQRIGASEIQQHSSQGVDELNIRRSDDRQNGPDTQDDKGRWKKEYDDPTAESTRQRKWYYQSRTVNEYTMEGKDEQKQPKSYLVKIIEEDYFDQNQSYIEKSSKEQKTAEETSQGDLKSLFIKTEPEPHISMDTVTTGFSDMNLDRSNRQCRKRLIGCVDEQNETNISDPHDRKCKKKNQ